MHRAWRQCLDEWGLEALELKAWMVILGTKIGENSDTHKLIGELGGFPRGTRLNIGLGTQLARDCLDTLQHLFYW